jgi:hypothetical protein
MAVIMATDADGVTRANRMAAPWEDWVKRVARMADAGKRRHPTAVTGSAAAE